MISGSSARHSCGRWGEGVGITRTALCWALIVGDLKIIG